LEFDFGGVAERVEDAEEGLGHEGDFAVFLASGLHGDLHVLAEGSQKVHETLDGKGTGAVAHQNRNVRLLDAENLASFGLL